MLVVPTFAVTVAFAVAIVPPNTVDILITLPASGTGILTVEAVDTSSITPYKK
jgi:hypothetical protein